ncbi:MAG: glycosyltransferase [Candidatus Hydrogenedens sp.]|nr:glycosyltransferase [Candidatus Hydrogenedens sp.]
MRIVFFGNAATNIAAIRYRVIRFAEMLEADGHRCTVCLPSSFAIWDRLYGRGNRLTKLLYLLVCVGNRLLQLRHVPGADAVVLRGPLVYGGYGPPLLERLCHALNPRMVYDIDDAVWVAPDGVDSPFQRWANLDWIWAMGRLCVHGIVGNQYLADQVQGRSPEVTIIPTCIDMDRHRAKSYPEPIPGRPVTLGWTGLYSNLVNLDIIASPLQQLSADGNVKLHVATGRPYALDGVTVENEHWVVENEIRYLQQADIGLMPLLDTPSTRGKCAFKALQYMGVGTPCVVSPVGMNAEIIEDGVNGFLASTPEEWLDKLKQLVDDPALRERMGRAARQTVLERYSHAANYPKLKAALVSASGSGR